MANVNETNDWPNGVYQYSDGDVLDGGPDSSETLPIRQLASRSTYQRLRNVTPWDAALAATHGYPAGACVTHAGVSWRAKLLNSVEPGTDPARWERWGFSQSELDNYIEDRFESTENVLPESNGWTRLPTGIILQWGAVTRSGAAAGAGNVVPWSANFPTPFPNQCLCAIATSGWGGVPHVETVNDPVEHNISINSWDAAGMQGLALRIYGSPSAGDVLNINWMAFGI